MKIISFTKVEADAASLKTTYFLVEGLFDEIALKRFLPTMDR